MTATYTCSCLIFLLILSCSYVANTGPVLTGSLRLGSVFMISDCCVTVLYPNGDDVTIIILWQLVYQ